MITHLKRTCYCYEIGIVVCPEMKDLLLDSERPGIYQLPSNVFVPLNKTFIKMRVDSRSRLRVATGLYDV